MGRTETVLGHRGFLDGLHLVLELFAGRRARSPGRDELSLLAALGQPHIDGKRVVMEIPLAERPGIR